MQNLVFRIPQKISRFPSIKAEEADEVGKKISLIGGGGRGSKWIKTISFLLKAFLSFFNVGWAVLGILDLFINFFKKWSLSFSVPRTCTPGVSDNKVVLVLQL